jgi:hypothetical protein
MLSLQSFALALTMMLFLSLPQCLQATEITYVDHPKQALPIPSPVAIQLLADRETYFIGDAILLHYQVTNTGSQPLLITQGGDYRGATRSTRFHVTAVDEHQEAVPDPDPISMNMGGLESTIQIPPGQSATLSLPLMRYCHFERQGTYTIRVGHDLGWTISKLVDADHFTHKMTRVSEDDPRWATLTLKLQMPDAAQAEKIVRAMTTLPETSQTLPGVKDTPYADYAGMRYPVYLPALKALALDGNIHAVLSLTDQYTPQATQALIELIQQDENRDSANMAMDAMIYRLPTALNPYHIHQSAKWNPPSDWEILKQERITRSWRPEFTSPLRDAIAAKLMRQASAPAQDQSIRTLAILMARLAGSDDLPLITQTLDMLFNQNNADLMDMDWPQSPINDLIYAGGILIRGDGQLPADPGTPAEVIFTLMGSRSGKSQVTTEQWQSWAKHDNAHVRHFVLLYLPQPLDDLSLNIVKAGLKDRHRFPQAAAVAMVAQSRDPRLKEDMLTLLASDRVLINSSAYDQMIDASILSDVASDDVMLAVANQLETTDKHIFTVSLNRLATCFGEVSTTPTYELTGEPEKLRDQWMALLQVHRKTLREGRSIPLTAQHVTPDLFPPGWKVHLDGKLIFGQP